MQYDKYRYLFPPRPTVPVSPTTLSVYEKAGWWAQAKMNGTCTIIYVPPNRYSFAMGRAGEHNRLVWQPGKRWKAFEQHVPGEGFTVFVGELLHTRGVYVRDTMYLHDILVQDGEYLIGVPYRQRYDRLVRVCEAAPGPYMDADTHTVISEGVWLAKNHRDGFRDRFAAIRNLPGKPPVEGLVFKDPATKLMPCSAATSNNKGQAKCRVPTDHLSF